jgi:hypothetical protein
MPLTTPIPFPYTLHFGTLQSIAVYLLKLHYNNVMWYVYLPEVLTVSFLFRYLYTGEHSQHPQAAIIIAMAVEVAKATPMIM